MADLADCLSRQWHHTRDPGRTDPFGQLQKRHRPQDDPHLLNAAAQQFSQFLPVPGCDLNRNAARAMPQVWGKTF